MKTYKFCQSCGYPLKKDTQGGGSEKDGEISKKYCSMCYDNGEFITPAEIDTAKKMQTFLYKAKNCSSINASDQCAKKTTFFIYMMGDFKFCNIR